MSGDLAAILISSVAIVISAVTITWNVVVMKRQDKAVAARLAAEGPAKRELRARAEVLERASRRRRWRRP